MRGQLKLTKQDKEWALSVKRRDENKCVICGETSRLNAHHIIVRENDDTKLDINNGISLCPKHHFFCRKVSAHNNPIGFFIWLKKNRPNQYYYIIEKMENILNDGV